jgi:hypothetical protein
MFAFGDERTPANDSVNVLEEILIEFMTDVVSRVKYAWKLAV